MTINIGKIAERLKRARVVQDLTLENVNHDTGISPERLSRIESGEMIPSGDEILILSDYYRHDFRDFVEENRPAPFDETEILYRKHGSDFTSDDRRSIQEFLFLCEIEAELEQKMEVRKSAFSFEPKGRYFKGHGEQGAVSLRKLLGYNGREVPMDVFKDFRSIGIHVFRRKLANSDISGLYIEHPYAGHCILVNYEEDIYRQRFSASHEAAHAIFDSSEVISVSYDRSSAKYDFSDMREIRANRFASCYLMPPNLLPRVSVWDKDSAIKWANMLKVSTAALSYALLDANMIDGETAKTIRSISVPRESKTDPEAPSQLAPLQVSRRRKMLERGLSNYYVGLCFDAYKSGIISLGRLSEVLLVDHSGVSEISILYGIGITHEL